MAKENYRFVRVVERGSGEQARLRLFDDMEYHPSETEISAALKKMLVTPVKVGAITGHQERSTTKREIRITHFCHTWTLSLFHD